MEILRQSDRACDLCGRALRLILQFVDKRGSTYAVGFGQARFLWRHQRDQRVGENLVQFLAGMNDNKIEVVVLEQRSDDLDRDASIAWAAFVELVVED